jgi:hypothetical protein
MLQNVVRLWRKWRESNRQYKIERLTQRAAGRKGSGHDPDLPSGPINPPTPGV